MQRKKESKRVLLYPGGFKPFHGGHLEILHRYVEEVNPDTVVIYQSEKERGAIDCVSSMAFITSVIEESGILNFGGEILTKHCKIPVLECFKAVETGCFGEGDYTMAYSSKGKDGDRAVAFFERHQPGEKYYGIMARGVTVTDYKVNVEPLVYTGRGDEYDGQPISSTVLREDIGEGDLEKAMSAYPNIESIREILKTYIEKWAEPQDI